MTKRNARKNNATYPTMLEYSESSGESLAEIMRMAGKVTQAKCPAPYKGHYVVINSKGELYLMHPKDIGALE